MDQKIVCKNHPDKPMSRIPEYYAITKVEKKKENVAFNPSSGIPLVVFACDICGYLEFYPAVKFRDWNEGQLYIKCKKCSSDFPSPIQMDRESFKSSTLEGNSFECPHCNSRNSYDKKDLFFK